MGRIPRIRAAVAVLTVALLGGVATSDAAQAYSNGYLPEKALSPAAITINCQRPEGELANRAAAGFNTLALAAGKKLEINGCMSAYRPYADQQYLYTHCPQLCAVPGTSNHGLGQAVDVAQWVRTYIDSTHGKFGFDKSCSDAPTEWWHVVLCRPFHRPNPGVHLHSPRLRRGSGGPGQAPWVKKAQKLLRRHGAKHLKPDGDFGPQTAFAVKQFQAGEQLHPDGVVTGKVWKHLRQPVVKPKPAPKPHHGGHPHGHHSGHNHHHPHGHGHSGHQHGGHSSGPITGVDVSSAQGSVNWQAVRQDGQRFAIVKATEGQDYRDPTFTKARLDAIRKAGLAAGVYHFLRPEPSRHGSREAQWFIHTITAAGYGHGDLPPVIDVETTTLSPTGTCNYVHSFYRAVKHTLHLHPLVYTYPGFAQTNFTGCDWILGKRLWIANYGVSHPTIAPWSKYLMWQYSDSGHVAGINGSVDLDRLPGGVRALRHLQIQPAKKLTQRPKAPVAATAPDIALPAPVLDLFSAPAPHAE